MKQRKQTISLILFIPLQSFTTRGPNHVDSFCLHLLGNKKPLCSWQFTLALMVMNPEAMCVYQGYSIDFSSCSRQWLPALGTPPHRGANTTTQQRILHDVYNREIPSKDIQRARPKEQTQLLY